MVWIMYCSCFPYPLLPRSLSFSPTLYHKSYITLETPIPHTKFLISMPLYVLPSSFSFLLSSCSLLLFIIPNFSHTVFQRCTYYSFPAPPNDSWVTRRNWFDLEMSRLYLQSLPSIPIMILGIRSCVSQAFPIFLIQSAQWWIGWCGENSDSF